MDLYNRFRQAILDSIESEFNSLIDSMDMSRHGSTFVDAVHYQRYEMAKRMIENSVDVTFDNSKALYHAIANKNDEFVTILVKKGCDVTVDNSKTLSVACRLGYTFGIKALVDAGADISTSNVLYGFDRSKNLLEILFSNTDIRNLKENLEILFIAGLVPDQKCIEYIEKNNIEELKRYIR